MKYMNNEILKQIEQEAEAFYEKQQYDWSVWDNVYVSKQAYIAGAKAWAEKYLAEKEKYEAACKMHDEVVRTLSNGQIRLLESYESEKERADRLEKKFNDLYDFFNH